MKRGETVSIRRLNLQYHDSKAVNLETIVKGGNTLKKQWGFMGFHNLLRCKFQTHEYVTAYYGESSIIIFRYPTS